MHGQQLLEAPPMPAAQNYSIEQIQRELIGMLVQVVECNQVLGEQVEALKWRVCRLEQKEVR